MADRFWEIDFLRGLAVIGMIAYHFLFDLNFFEVIALPTESLGWFIFPRTVAAIFIFLVGVSLAISYDRSKEELTEREMKKKYLKRSLKIFVYGLLISAATWIFIPEAFVIFGILHFIGISIFLGYLILKFDISREKILSSVLFVLFTGALLQYLQFNFPWLLWLGFIPKNLQTLDYFPLLPWFALILAGLYMGRKFYDGVERKFDLREISNPLVNSFAFLGRYSLEIYFLHQPLLISLIYLLT